MGHDRSKWPIEPLESFIMARGTGIEALARARGLEEYEAKKLGSMMVEARKQGALTLRAMDRICCDGLGIHPMQVYGMDYFSTEYDLGVRSTSGCVTCGEVKAFGSRRYCIVHLTERQLCGCGCGELKPQGQRTKYIDGHKAHNLGRPKKAA